jgi:hypothetical protein
LKIGGEGRKDLGDWVLRGRAGRSGCRGGEGWRVWGRRGVQVSGRLSGGSGDALVIVCVGGPRALAGARWSALAL